MDYTCKPLKVGLFDNRKKRYTMAQVKALLGEDYIVINGGLFDNVVKSKTYLEPCCDIKIDGTVLADDRWGYEGVGWKNGQPPRYALTSEMPNLDNFFSCVWAITNGKKVDMIYPADMNNLHGRTAWGVLSNGDIYVLCTTNANGAMTMEQAQDKLLTAGCVIGVINDCGGSCQGIFPNGTIYSTRIVSNFVYIQIDKSTTEKPKEDDTKVTKLIAIDAGHGVNTYGKRCLKSIDPNETREWFLNNRIACYVEKLLEEYDCETMRLDDVTGKTDVPLATRVNKANSANADMLASIHANAGIDGESGGGICVFAAVNGSETSDKLQKAVYKYTVAETELKGNRYDGVPDTNFYMIYKSNMPAFLGEFGFMDSTVDTPIILTDDFARKCAKGIVQGIVEVMGIEKFPDKPTKPVTSNSIFRVQVGAFPTRSAAERLSTELNAKGYKTIITEVKA